MNLSSRYTKTLRRRRDAHLYTVHVHTFITASRDPQILISLPPPGHPSRPCLSARGVGVPTMTTGCSETSASKCTWAEPQFFLIPVAPGYQPSRKREEAFALRNLRKRLQAVEVLKANRAEPIEASSPNNNDVCGEDLDRPYLLKKILINRPVSMVLDMSEIRTAWQDSDFITDCLCWHNVYRQRHAVPPLTMSSELCYLAQTWANHLAHTNRFYYRNDRDIGQNLFCRPSNGLVQEVSGREVATYWYTSTRRYDYFKEPLCLHVNVNAGHFTQMVWRSTRLCGVGKARSRSGKLVVVAHYFPPGNQLGGYVKNVPPPSGIMASCSGSNTPDSVI